jgi:hypothetical protein
VDKAVIRRPISGKVRYRRPLSVGKAVIGRPVTVDKAVVCRSVTVDKGTSSSSFAQCLNMLLIFNLCKSEYFPTRIVGKRPVYVIFYIFDIHALQGVK